jgi:mRNA interferase HigB
MRIISKRTLRTFWQEHKDAEGALRAWHADVEGKTWATPMEVKADYPRASIVANNRVVFNIVGGNYRLVVAIKYEFGLIYIRFVGKHSDYDNIDATTI